MTADQVLPAIPTVDTWTARVEGHGLWDRVPDGADAARKATLGAVEQLADVARGAAPALDGDPWWDPGAAARALDRLEDLTAAAPAGEQLGAVEVALLLVAPCAQAARVARAVAAARAVGPQDLTPSEDATTERTAFERFAMTFPQAHRRAVEAVARRAKRTVDAPDGPSAGPLAGPSAGPDAAAEIGWWVLHQWVRRRLSTGEAADVDTLLDLPADAPFTAAQLAQVLRSLRAVPALAAAADRDGAPGEPRPALVRALSAAAHALAVEVAALPEVVADHLGTRDPVRPGELLRTLAAARWQARERTLDLAVECPHPAVDVALQAHSRVVDHVLEQAHRVAVQDRDLPLLQHLPTHVTTDGLGPTSEDGGPAYRSAGVRFRLAEDRVRELLMGEQLYGDPALAIREQYQNALDACRYRAARTEFLERTRGGQAPWRPVIRFEQGVDEDGRAYLDCVDNGVGMGVQELGSVFAQAGVRFGDLPEFLEEQDAWARLDPPVRVHPNSRFGIGVLSYFMLAEEITVDTCRLGPDGALGERLRVSIAGPGNLFRIRSLGPGTEPGTTVRLHLREGVTASCVTVLRDLLWVGEVDTHAVHDAARHSWVAGQLSSAAGPSARDGKTFEEVVPTPGGRVWWCKGKGAILADGLWAGTTIYGAVVDLRGDLAPRLTVDRTKMLAHRKQDVDQLLWAAVPALTAARSRVLTFEWLYAMAAVRPMLADVIFEQALADGYREWTIEKEQVDAAVSGCFWADANLKTASAALVSWRVTALSAAGLYRRMLTPEPGWAAAVRARPSDQILLSTDADGSAPWLDAVLTVPLPHVVRVARIVGRDAAEVAARLEALGFTVAAGSAVVGVDPDDLVLMSSAVEPQAPWLPLDEPVSLLHLLRCADRTGRPVRDLADRLVRLGHDVPDAVRTSTARLEPDDDVLASVDLDARGPWLAPGREVGIAHLVRAARKVGRPVAEVAQRLDVLGYPQPPGAPFLSDGPHDLVLLSRDRDGVGPWLDPYAPVGAGHVLTAATRCGLTPAEVAERLVALGITLTFDPAATASTEFDAEDPVLCSLGLDGTAPWLEADRPVPLVHVLRAAEHSGRSVAHVVERLALLGHPSDVRPELVLADRLSRDDLLLLSQDLDGSHPWLDPAVPVPAVHLLRSAQRTALPVQDVAARLAFLGHSLDVPAGSLSTLRAQADDLVITSKDLDGSRPWLDQDRPVPLPFLLAASRATRRSVAQVSERLTELGYEPDPRAAGVTAEKVRTKDVTLISRDLDGVPPWIDADEPVPIPHLLAASRKAAEPVADVVERLRALGFTVRDLDTWLPRMRPGGV